MRSSIRILITALLLTFPGTVLAQNARIAYPSTSAVRGTAAYPQTAHPIMASPASMGLDAEFGTDGRVVTDIDAAENLSQAVGMLPDGRIVLVGSYVDSATESENTAVVVYNADGSLDSSFGGDGIVTTDVSVGEGDRGTSVAVEADGKIVVAGFAAGPAYEGDSDFAVVRYNPDGSLDSGFGTGGIVTTNIDQYDDARGVAVLPDGKIVVVGVTGQSPAKIGLVRYLADGSLDPTFGTDGIVNSDAGVDVVTEEMVVQPDGKILVLGNDYPVDFFSPEPTLVRFNPDGSRDTSFGTNGVVYEATDAYDPAQGLAIGEGGEIFVVGFERESPSSGKNDLTLTRYFSDGTPDGEFGTDGRIRLVTETIDNFTEVVIQQDGKPLVVGTRNFESLLIQRFNPDGAIDASLGTGGTIETAGSVTLNDAVLQADGKLVVAGSIETGVPADFQDMQLMRFDVGTTVTAVEEFDTIPSTAFNLEPNYPNPFQETTTIRFSLPESGNAVVRVFDLMGREVDTVLNGYHQAGPVETRFDARGLSAGIYLYQLTVDGQPVATGRMTRIK